MVSKILIDIYLVDWDNVCIFAVDLVTDRWVCY